MRSTSITWPESALGCPLASSWSATVQPRFGQLTLNPPITTYAPEQVEEKRIHTCGFIWSRAQLGIFEDWHRDTLLQGMRWFMMDFLVAGAMVPCYSHIVGGYTIGDEQGHVTVGMTVESYRRTGTETG